ncbi:hypothetical protein, partial [Glaesserella parasuis]|uniref:hypothetical protein n=1 Tax=Glaesserella parasuis TaxID=738 RepID=UPI003F389E8D
QDVYGLNGRQTQNSLTLRSEDDDDFVHKYILYHDRTPAMPYGRRTEIIAGQVLDDGHLLYEKVPVVRMSAGEVLRTPFGDSPAIDLLPLQQALNSLFSGTVTN